MRTPVAAVCLLIQDSPVIEDGNYLRIGIALIRRGHTVNCCLIDSLTLSRSKITGQGFALTDGLKAGDELPSLQQIVLEEHDLVWVLTIGERWTFLDKVQLLYTLPREVEITNSLDALMHLKSKYFLTSREVFRCPETHASRSADELAGIIRSSGGRWIVKPPAGSLGRDVFLTEADDNNLMAILQHLCGPDNNHYTMIQRYLPEIENGEKRVLLAGGQVIGQYLRLPNQDHRTNVSQGASVHVTKLTDEESAYCLEVGKFLTGMGAHYVGLDLVYPWLIETNVISPGGLTTIAELEGKDLGEDVARNVLEACHLEF